jgi:hypothetical protein
MELALNSAAGVHALLTRNGNTIRIRLRGVLRTRLVALALLAASTFGLYVAGVSVGQVLNGIATEREMLPGQLILLAIAVCGLPGLMWLLVRTYVEIDNTLCQVTAVRQYGPIRSAKTVPLAGISQVRTTVDDDLTTYRVELIGPRPTDAIVVGFSRRRAECQAFARDLRRALKISFDHPSHTAPDAD